MSNPENLCTLYVSQLPWSVRNKHLESFFEEFGTITDCYIAYRGKQSRGFGYVTFSVADAATKALGKDGAKMAAQEDDEPREIVVVLAKPRPAEVEAAAKERLAKRAEARSSKGPKGEAAADDDKAPAGKGKKKEGKGGKKKEGKGGGKGGRGPKPEAKNASASGEAAAPAGDAPKKKKKSDQVQFNIAPEQMDFLKTSVAKYELKNLNQAAKKLLQFAAEDTDDEVFAGNPSRPEKSVHLRVVLSTDERALLEKAKESHGYNNRHAPVQALIAYVMPDGEDPAEAAASARMCDDIFQAELKVVEPK